MFEARTAWAIALLLAPTGVAAAGTMAAVTAPAQHTAYVEIVMTEDDRRDELATVEANVACPTQGPVREALDWMARESGCQTPPGSAVYVTRATAPSPLETGGLVPTGDVYAYQEAEQGMPAREYVYGTPGEETYHAYVLSPDLSNEDTDTVRGVVNLGKLDVQPGERASLETSLGPGPQLTPQDPTVERVGDTDTTSIGETVRGLRG